MTSFLTPVAEPAAAFAVAETPSASPVATDQPARQRVIVELSSPGIVDLLAAAEARLGGSILHRYRSVLTGFAATLSPARIAALRANPLVSRIELDGVTHAAASQPAPPWGLDRIDQRAGLSQSYDYSTTGAGVTAYVIDSGIRFSHSDLGGRASSGYDFVELDSDASDCNGHGTHVSGTIGGSQFGVAKAASLVSLRVWGCSGSGYFSDMIAALDWVVSHKSGPSVVNISGAGSAYQPMDDAVERATAAGVPVVVAAGNDGADACLISPARAPSAITVGATTPGDARASFSNFGSCIDIFAPGDSVISSTVTSDTSSGYLSGTSMATPHVTGAVARYLQSNPGASPTAVASAILGAATTGVVTDSRSTNNRLLFVASAPADATSPTVLMLSPAADARSISQSASVTVTFDEPVVGLSSSTFTLRSGSAVVPASVTWNAATKVATLDPVSTLAPDALLNATVSGVTDAAGNAITPTSWSFRAGPAPTISTSTPASGATGVARTKNVAVTFSEAILGASSATVKLTRETTGAAVTATRSFSATTRTLTIDPGVTLSASSTYRVTITGGALAVRDGVGNPFVSRTWTFRTGTGL